MPAKRYKVNLLPEERDALQRLVDTGKASAYKRRRAQILLKADQSLTGSAWTDEQICEAFDVGQLTVSRTRKVFVFEGLEATLQRKMREHPPVARKLDGDGEARSDHPGVFHTARRLCQMDHAALRRQAGGAPGGGEPLR